MIRFNCDLTFSFFLSCPSDFGCSKKTKHDYRKMKGGNETRETLKSKMIESVGCGFSPGWIYGNPQRLWYNMEVRSPP